MKQECPLAFVWLTWLGLPGLALILGLSQGWLGAVFVLLVGVIAQIVYIRWFPRIARWIGYGSVADVPAELRSLVTTVPRVMLYTANVCPFCPIIRQRLNELKRQTPFELEEVDVTFQPKIVRQKGLRSVPVIETDGRFLVGNATSTQLAEFLTEAAGSTG
ncbi:MAG: glutaredoxin family protein [Candidatus Marinimicrobia bacterium]|nr:glutaredoxin family protein [Candidatus Neomarinimicrobiota bacterium]